MRYVVVDTVGGALAAIGAAIVRSLGESDAAATSTVPIAPLPPEVERVLAEIGLAPVTPEAMRTDGARVVKIELAWGAKLYDGEGELERMANARIARDRIERKIHELFGQPLL